MALLLLPASQLWVVSYRHNSFGHRGSFLRSRERLVLNQDNNAGTRQGVISIAVVGDTTEPVTRPLRRIAESGEVYQK